MWKHQKALSTRRRLCDYEPSDGPSFEALESRHMSRSPPIWSQQLVLGDKTLCEFYLVLKCVWTRWVQRRGGMGWSAVHWCRLFSWLTFQYLVALLGGVLVSPTVATGHPTTLHPPSADQLYIQLNLVLSLCLYKIIFQEYISKTNLSILIF